MNNPAIPRAEVESRRLRALDLAQRSGCDGVVVFSPRHVFYYSLFGFLPTERPIALAFFTDGTSLLFAPQLELAHAEESAAVSAIATYPEYPDERHPMERLADLLRGRRLACDSDGYGGIQGYEGPRLGRLLGRDLPSIAPELRRLQQVKSDAEIALLRRSCHVADEAHRDLQELARAGAIESEVAAQASLRATRRLVESMGREYAQSSPFPLEAHAGFRGQVGARTALAHTMTTHAAMLPGDLLVTGAAGRVFGYRSELERTMVVGEPTARQRDLFAAMLALQDLGISLLRPGSTCAETDRAVRAAYRELGVADLWQHHTGHAIGMDGHESPFLDIGDPTPILPGMVFTVEPGIYIPGEGGYRHSDTVLVTERGPEPLTAYPRALEDLVVR